MWRASPREMTRHEVVIIPPGIAVLEKVKRSWLYWQLITDYFLT
jgi:hypothetical protein